MRAWKLRDPVIPYDKEDSITRKLAKIYGIQDIKKFLNPLAEDQHHYSLLANIEEAVNMILTHIAADHEIVIFCDIDHDGAASGAIFYRYLKTLTDKVSIIHKQRRDGHGLVTAEDVVKSEIKLLIAIDSSTNDVESCERISSNGTDIIIIDHHEWKGNDNPFALIVNPQMPDCSYPNKNLSGGMVAYKVCQALDDYTGQEYADELVDLAGLSLLADSMSVIEPENRYYIDRALKEVKNVGLLTLLRELKIDPKDLDANKFSYSVSPCVSAITRKNEFEKAIGLYISDDAEECQKLAKELVKANKERKQIQKNSYKIIQPQINENDKCIVVVEPSIGKEFNGLVAQVISETYNRPAIVFGHKTEESPSYTGSFRSPNGFSMLDFLEEIQNATFTGGHPEAGGTGCWKNRLEDFKNEVNEKLKDTNFNSEIIYDIELSIDEIDEKLIKEMNAFFRICGKDFKPARVLIKDLFVLEKSSIGDGDTLRAKMCCISKTWFTDNFDEIKPELIGMRFRIFDDFLNEFPVHKAIDVIGSLNINEYMQWRPERKLIKNNQVFIEDYRLSE